MLCCVGSKVVIQKVRLKKYTGEYIKGLWKLELVRFSFRLFQSLECYQFQLGELDHLQ